MSATAAYGAPVRRKVVCHECGEPHEATFSHLDPWSGADLYAAVCSEDWLTDYYTEAALIPL